MKDCNEQNKSETDNIQEEIQAEHPIVKNIQKEQKKAYN